MENKNFEKKETQGLHPSKLEDGFTIGYNTCLDRTNAKGIYEALKLMVENFKPDSVTTLSEKVKSIQNGINQLAKAEQ